MSAFPTPIPKVHLSWTPSVTPGSLTNVLRSPSTGGPYIPVTLELVAGFVLESLRGGLLKVK